MARPDRPNSVYLDACCFIDWATGKYSARQVETWLVAAQTGQVVLYTSTLTLSEARGTSATAPNPAAEQKIRTLLGEPYVLLVDVTRRVGLKARDLTTTYPRIKNCDAIHMASAIFAGAEVLLTRNTRDFAPGTLVEGVWVDEPYEFGGATLFSASDE